MVQRVGVKFGVQSSNTIRNNYLARNALHSNNECFELTAKKIVKHSTDEEGNQIEHVTYSHTKSVPYSLDKQKRWEFVNEILESEKEDLSIFEKKKLRKIANRETKKQQNQLKHASKHSNVRKILKQTEEKQQVSEENEEENSKPIVVFQDHLDTADVSRSQQATDFLVSMIPEKHKAMNKYAQSGDGRDSSYGYYKRMKNHQHKMRQEPIEEIHSIFSTISKRV